MAKRIGSLAVVISADGTAFDRAMRSAVTKVQAFPSVVGRASSAISGKFAALAGAAAAALSVRSLLRTAEAIDGIAKAADRLNVPVDRLMGIQYGAELAGISAETLNQSFLSMIRNTELGARGLGRARSAFEELGIDVEKVASLDAENQFKVIAEAISRLEDRGHAASVAMRIFGDSGASLVPLFRQGAAGVEAMQREADALGLTLNAVDVSRVVEAQDAMTRVRSILSSISNALVVELAPYVTAVAEQFVEWSKTGGTWREIVGNAVRLVAVAVAKLADMIDYGRIAWHTMRVVAAGALLAVLKPVQLLINGVVRLVELAGNYLPRSMVDAAQSARAFAEGMSEGLGDVARDAGAEIERIWTSRSMTDRVEDFFASVEHRAAETAAEIAANAQKPIDYSQKMYENVLKPAAQSVGEAAAETFADEIEDRVKNVSFGSNAIIRAGSAEAQAVGIRSFVASLERSINRQIEVHNQQLRVQREIAKNTSRLPDEAEVEYVFDG